MSRREAQRFEEALQKATRGEPVEGKLASLVGTAAELRSLAGPPPPPPQRLSAGRQRLLAEAARMQAEGAPSPVYQSGRGVALRLGVSLAALLVLCGMVLGAGRAAAAALPGEPLYQLKAFAETFRLTATTDPLARSELTRALANSRIDEITLLLEQHQEVKDPVVRRAGAQLATALQTASDVDGPGQAAALRALAEDIQQRQQTMAPLVAEVPNSPARALLREMERVRQEAHEGLGEPDGQPERQRNGEPAEPSDRPLPSRTPVPTQQTARPSTLPPASRKPNRTAQPSMSPQPSRTPHRTADPSMTPQPSQTPHRTAEPSMTPQPSQTPHRTAEPSMTPQPSQTPRRTAEPSMTPRKGGG
jgi:hypothetical protein